SWLSEVDMAHGQTTGSGSPNRVGAISPCGDGHQRPCPARSCPRHPPHPAPVSRIAPMIRAARLILLGVALASWLGVGVAVAGALVEFPNVSEQAPKLTGYLARPDAGLSALAGRQFDRVGPYPAVVVLHGCGGISSHSTGIADRLGSWGYVALAGDSPGPRGISNACGGGGRCPG